MDKQAQKEREITTVEHIPERDVEKSLSENKKSGDQSSPSEEELKLVRKLDLRILPIACLLYLFACMSRYLLANEMSSLNNDYFRFGSFKSGECSSPRINDRCLGRRSEWPALRMARVNLLFPLCVFVRPTRHRATRLIHVS